MSPTTAALILAWIVLSLLAFALAGVLQQLRTLQRNFASITTEKSGAVSVAPREVSPLLLPSNSKGMTVALLVTDGCPICESVVPTFAEIAALGKSIDFVILNRSDSVLPSTSGPIRFVADSGAYMHVDPGWKPALIMIDGTGKVLRIEPAGSRDAVRAGVRTAVAMQAQS